MLTHLHTQTHTFQGVGEKRAEMRVRERQREKDRHTDIHKNEETERHAHLSPDRPERDKGGKMGGGRAAKPETPKTQTRMGEDDKRRRWGEAGKKPGSMETQKSLV